MGLRLKFNLVIVPLVVALTLLMAWGDYRHEQAVTMAPHVARDSLRAHAVYAVVLVVLLIAAINAALHVLVLRPLRRSRFRLARMERGHWRGSIEPTSQDEMGQFVHSFQVLGLEIDALVGQSLRADRLGILALLSQELRARLEPDLGCVARIAAKLNGCQEIETRAAAHELARHAASMFATVRGIEHAFPGDGRSGHGGRPASITSEGASR